VIAPLANSVFMIALAIGFVAGWTIWRKRDRIIAALRRRG